jgi:hypothetical protein
LIVASHYSKTFLHFSKGFTIFCQEDQENTNNGNDTEDNEAVVWQKSNLPSLLSLASTISTQAALDASAELDTLAATASFGHISLINLSALLNHWLNGYIGFISIVGLVDLLIGHLISVSLTLSASMVSSASWASLAAMALLASLASLASLALSA